MRLVEFNLETDAVGNMAQGLLLCSWPHGGRPRLPFVYSDEVWTGIEYDFSAFWSTGKAWGIYRQRLDPATGEREWEVEVLYGNLEGIQINRG